MKQSLFHDESQSNVLAGRQRCLQYMPMSLLLSIVIFLSGCQMSTPPRLSQATAVAQRTPTPTPEKLISTLETQPTLIDNEQPATPNAEPNPSLSIWVNETSAAHETALTQMAADFTAVENIDVELQFISPLLLPDLVNTAVLSGTLPDIIIHPLPYTHGWVEKGILNSTAANTALTRIGPDTFDPQALELVTGPDGAAAALPTDGFFQLLIYRTDWFAEQNLETPDRYETMYTAAESSTDRENLRAGFVVPTEANLVSTHQAFEHIALANGCDLIDEKGEVLLLAPACSEALDFYYQIINQFSPIGVQTDTSTRNAYLAGRTGLILVTPDIIPQLAGLDPLNLPVCPECGANPQYLAQNSGFLTTIQGSVAAAEPTTFSHITNLGITTAADEATAVTFANFWFNEGYPQWLAVNSERKVPLRLGTTAEPRLFIEAWGSQPLAASEESLQTIFGQTLVRQLRDGIAASPRWGLEQGYGPLVTQIYEKLTLSVTLQEMLSGYFRPEQTIIEAYKRVTDLIPNYQYDVELEDVESEEVETETDE